MKEKVVLVGGGGNCKVVIDVLRQNDTYEIFGITDVDGGGRVILGIPVIGTDEVLGELYHQGIRHGLITLGSVGNNGPRIRLFNKLKALGFHLINAIHPKAILGEGLVLGEGNMVMAGSMINPCVIIGNNCIINTGSIIEHDCIIGDHVHIAPGAKLSGGVKVGSGAHVGLGANIIQGISIGAHAIIGAGAVVTKDVPDCCVAVGVPAKVIKENIKG